MVRIHSSFRVAAPAGRDDVEPAVAVQVARGHAVPPTDDPVQLVLGGGVTEAPVLVQEQLERDRKSTRLNSSHGYISYAVFCLKKKKKKKKQCRTNKDTSNNKYESDVQSRQSE